MIEIRIAKPCDQTWTAMKGDAQVRHCGACRKNVYNIAEMTEREIEELIRRTEGKFCARIYRRTDGRVLTKDCPRGVATVRRRRTLAVTAAMTAVAGYVLFPVMGGTSAPRQRRASLPGREEPVTDQASLPEMTMGIVSRPRIEMGARSTVIVETGDARVVPRGKPATPGGPPTS